MSPPAAAHNAARVARTSATIGSDHGAGCDPVGSPIAVLHQFIRRTQDRCLVPSRSADVLDTSTKDCVRDVGDIPGQHDVNTMTGRHGHVSGVRRCLPWQWYSVMLDEDDEAARLPDHPSKGVDTADDTVGIMAGGSCEQAHLHVNHQKDDHQYSPEPSSLEHVLSAQRLAMSRAPSSFSGASAPAC